MSCSTTFKIKSKNDNEIRRVTLAEPSWTNFVAFVTKTEAKSSHQQQEALSKVSISYLDEEADKVCVSCEAEFTEALAVQAANSVKVFSVEAIGHKSCHTRPFKGHSFAAQSLFDASNLFPTTSSSDPNNNNNNNNNSTKNSNSIDVEGLSKVAQEFFKKVNGHNVNKDDSPAQQNHDQKEEASNSNSSQYKELDLKGAFEEFTKVIDSVGDALPHVAAAFSSVVDSHNHNDNESESKEKAKESQEKFEKVLEPLNDLVKKLFCGPSFGTSDSSADQAAERSQPNDQEGTVGEQEQEQQAVEADQFAEELALLKELGFGDKQTNLSLLASAKGDLQTVINSLVDL